MCPLGLGLPISHGKMNAKNKMLLSFLNEKEDKEKTRSKEWTKTIVTTISSYFNLITCLWEAAEKPTCQIASCMICAYLLLFGLFSRPEIRLYLKKLYKQALVYALYIISFNYYQILNKEIILTSMHRS